MRNAFSKLFLSSVLMLSMPMVAGSCIQPVDPNAMKEIPNLPPTRDEEHFTPVTTIEPTDRPIQLAPEHEEMVTADPCEKTKNDKDEILKVYCSGCHQAPLGNSGQPLFDFILDDARLVTETIPRDGAPPQSFITPGNPAQSLLYTRVAARSMPPASMMLGVMAAPAPTLSDISVLADWITNCAPGARATPPSGTGGSSGSGGAAGPAGTGGSTGTGGNRGAQGTGGSTGSAPDAGATGGSSSPDAGGQGNGGTGPANDAGTGAGGAGVVVACANNVANGAVCAAQPPCRMNNLTCTCAGANGQRRWACR